MASGIGFVWAVGFSDEVWDANRFGFFNLRVSLFLTEEEAKQSAANTVYLVKKFSVVGDPGEVVSSHMARRETWISALEAEQAG